MDTKDQASQHVKVGQARDQFIILKRSGEHYTLVYRRELEGSKGVVGRNQSTKTAFRSWNID